MAAVSEVAQVGALKRRHDQSVLKWETECNIVSHFPAMGFTVVG
jgi:hypothetical protein